MASVLCLVPSQPLAQAVPDDVRITLERTPCGGECPVYSVSIDASGHVTYAGTRFVRVQGLQTDRIPVSRVAALLETAGRIGIYELRDQYHSIRNPDGTETVMTDRPTIFVTIARNGRSKRVEDYFGAPEGLRTLEREIDAAARTSRWIRLDLATLQQLVREGWSPSIDERAELLHTALEFDEVDMVKALLAIGADANHAYFSSHTVPLMFVRSAAATRALLDAGANPLMSDDNGATPLGQTTHLPPDVADVLLKAGVPVDQAVHGDGRTALWGAACSGNVAVVKVLLAAGADPAARAVGISASECAWRGQRDAQARGPFPFDGKPLFVKDFDGVLAVLEQALAQQPRR